MKMSDPLPALAPEQPGRSTPRASHRQQSGPTRVAPDRVDRT